MASMDDPGAQGYWLTQEKRQIRPHIRVHATRLREKGAGKDGDALSHPGSRPDANALLGNPTRSAIDDLGFNGMSSGNVGSYVPTEFPLEAKLVQPAYQMESASPSS
eukprot:CAMPEP_0170465204 /NCGR_PEP_ID=MMETSP0123-20130129/9632_1 /TAXON_ID=182087 /ORGANISM="Favella ehrenbergii, Strain Fehren 1" /LENGTH=106 /DNA_ID=CAMNT_0010731035 /DNA_START=839 /DNA_END=1157 /DNA_ORIENTATION=+